MSRVVKSSKVMLDNKKFRLSPEISHVSVFENEGIHSGTSTEGVEGMEQEQLENHEHYMDRLKAEAELIIEQAAFAAKERELQAEAESERLIGDAMDRAFAIESESREKGYKEGFEVGYNEGASAAQLLIDEAHDFKEAIMAQYMELMNNAESELVEMIQMGVAKILGQQMANDPMYIEGIVRKGIEACTYRESLVIRLSPDDMDMAEAVRLRLVTRFEKIDDLVFKADAALTRGSCIVDTLSGSIDSSISTQMNQLRDALEAILHSE